MYFLLTFKLQKEQNFNFLVRNSNTSFQEFVLQLQKQASKSNFGDKLEKQLRNRLIAGVNHPELQRRLLIKTNLSFADAKEMCEQHDDVQAATSESNTILLHQQATFQTVVKTAFQRNQSQPMNSNFKPVDQGKCMSCGESHLRLSCRFCNVICHYLDVGYIEGLTKL